MFSLIIVDDNRLVSEGIRDLVDWEELDIEIVGLAANGVEGYDMAVKLKPDFVMADVDMPIMDGLDMAAKIKEDLPETKFIFISCFDDFNYVKEAMDLEAYKYVLKPIDFEELTTAVRRLVAAKYNHMVQRQMEREIKEQLAKSIPVLQEQFFRDIIYGKLKVEEDILKHMNYLGMESVQKHYLVFFIEIDNYDERFAEVEVEKKYFIIEGIKKYVKQVVFEGQNGYFLNQQHNSVAFIIFLKSPNKDEELETLMDSLSECKDSINRDLSVNLTIGVSDFSDRMTELARLLQSAEYTVKAKFYSEGNRIILSSEVKNEETYDYYNLQEIKVELKQIFEQGRQEDIYSLIQKYYSLDIRFPQSYVKSLTFSIVNIVQTLLIERNQSLSNIFESDTIMWAKLSKFETIVDIKKWITEVLNEVWRYLNNRESNRYRKIIDDIKYIIDSRYAEVNNIEEIVKPLYISASHANLIFKQQTGHTIFDYLVQARMEAAKKLLQNPYSKVYEVSEKVGYKNKSYFSAIFKEYTGMTPRQFTDSNSK
jgi:two-component system, response regulator YesN